MLSPLPPGTVGQHPRGRSLPRFHSGVWVVTTSHCKLRTLRALLGSQRILPVELVFLGTSDAAAACSGLSYSWTQF